MAYKITATISGGSVDSTGNIFASLTEYTGGVASGTDGSSSTSGTTPGTSLTAGSFTTAVNGDIVVGIVFPTIAQTPSLTAGTGFTKENQVLIGSNNAIGYADEFQIQSTAGAVNPSFTASATTRWVMVAGAIKKSSGTFSIVSSQNIAGEVAPGASITIAPAATPTNGDVLIVGVAYVLDGATNATTRTVTDNAGNTFTELVNIYQPTTANAGISFFYLLSFAGSTPSTLHLLPLLGCGS